MKKKNQPYLYKRLVKVNSRKSVTPHCSQFTAFSFLLFALSFFISGCKKFVEIPPPATELVSASTFNNNASATAALTNIYAAMFNNDASFNMSVNNGLLADELTNYLPTAQYQPFYQNALTPLTIANYGPWANGYNYIYQANAVIGGLQTTSGTSAAVKQQLTAEAQFIRAFWLFYLSNCYGAVPIVTTTNYLTNENLTRSSRQQVLLQVISDLTTAEGSLNNNYVDGTDTAVTTERVRPNKYVAAALLARAYLYYGQYDNSAYAKAATWSSFVINNNNSEYSLCPSLNSVFLMNSTETIWSLQTPTPVGNGATNDGQQYILISAPGTGNTPTAISPQLLAAFEPGDNRKSQWIGDYSPDGGVTNYYFPYKYKDYSTSGTVDEYVMVLRLAEQYLILAEAEANGATGGVPAAITDLNIIRNRAGLPNYAGAQTQAAVLTAILHERQVELFTEWGHRWFDLNRTGNINTVMGVVTPEKGGGAWQPFKALYPISQTEINTDKHLSQNSGY